MTLSVLSISMRHPSKWSQSDSGTRGSGNDVQRGVDETHSQKNKNTLDLIP